MQALTAVRDLQLPEWCIGAGAVRNLVWDALGATASPSMLADVDVAHFDPVDLTAEHDQSIEARLRAAIPTVPWEVTNQAAVHRWFEQVFGHPVAPLASLEEAVASWPEFATAVGLRLEPDDTITVIAPHGLDDLFDMIVRRNPTRVSVETYRRRVTEKKYAQRWPGVRIIAS
jgi:uncharacterized protein